MLEVLFVFYMNLIFYINESFSLKKLFSLIYKHIDALRLIETFRKLRRT